MFKLLNRKYFGDEVATIPNIAAMQQASNYATPDKSVFGSGVNFLPRLQLFTSNSEECKMGKIPIAHYGIVKGKAGSEGSLLDVGKSIAVIPLAWRAKAMHFRAEPIVAFHKQDSEAFQDIVKKANADSNAGYGYGPEFLFWHPDHGYVTFFMASKTARNSAPAVRALLPKGDGTLQVGVLSSQLIENKQFKWHGPTISPSSQSLTPPPADGLLVTIQEFLNPIDSAVEVAKPAPGAPSDR